MLCACKLTCTEPSAWCNFHTAPAQVTPENPMSVHELGFDSVWVHSGYFDIIQQTRALGRGHHGGERNPCQSMLLTNTSSCAENQGDCRSGGDWAEGWNLPRLRTVMALHYGFTSPTQCIKYLLGSHDQVCHCRPSWS